MRFLFCFQTGEEKLTCRDRLPAYMTNLVMMLLMVRKHRNTGRFVDILNQAQCEMTVCLWY